MIVTDWNQYATARFLGGLLINVLIDKLMLCWLIEAVESKANLKTITITKRVSAWLKAGTQKSEVCYTSRVRMFVCYVQ